jgi:hypothetical protein
MARWMSHNFLKLLIKITLIGYWYRSCIDRGKRKVSMSKKTIITLIAVTGFAAHSFAPEQNAIGSIRGPASEIANPSSEKAEKISKPKALLAKLKDKWSRFKPAAKNSNLDLVPVYSSKTTIEELFNPEFTERLKSEHASTVVPYEKEALNPFRRSSHWEMQRYEESRKALAQWTMKELGRDQLKEFIRSRKKDSGALSVIASTTGVEMDEEKAKAATPDYMNPNLSEKERIAKAHAYTPAAEVEEIIPTRLRAKLNIFKTQGQLTFMNPVVITSLQAKAGSGENIAVEMKKDFKKLELNSHLRYALDQSHIVFNVNKRITDEVSLDLNSERWTGSKRGDTGEKSKGTAKVVYSLSF